MSGKPVVQQMHVMERVSRAAAFLVLAAMLGLAGVYAKQNWSRARDEMRTRSIWIIQNGRMQSFLGELPYTPKRVFQINDDGECSVTVSRFMRGVCGKDVEEWVSMPFYLGPGGWTKPGWRSIEEMQALLSKAETGDILLVPVCRANVRYNRMPVFAQASSLFPRVVPEPVQKRLRRLFYSFDQFRHMSVPLNIEAGLLQQGKADLLAQVRREGLIFGLGWAVFTFE